MVLNSKAIDINSKYHPFQWEKILAVNMSENRLIKNEEFNNEKYD